MIDDESRRDPEKYQRWYTDFNQFIKEGITVDAENKDALFRLVRFLTRNGGSTSYISIDDYVAKMDEKQTKIYYISNQRWEAAINSPYMEPFKGQEGLDVIVLTHPVDEILFQQMTEYKGKKFSSVESSFEEIQKDLGSDLAEQSAVRSRIPEEEVTSFCLWLKNELSDSIGKVSISKRLTDTPALITGQMTSSMRVMM